MWAIGSVSSRLALIVGTIALISTGCTGLNSAEVRTVPIQQTWELGPGKTVGGHRVAGGLGDISLELKGSRVYAPFDGLLQPNDIEGCYIFSSEDVPAYLFRLCGLRGPNLGQVSQGDVLGSASYLEFAALRRQPDGQWTMVEPATDILERMLIPEGGSG